MLKAWVLNAKSRAFITNSPCFFSESFPLTLLGNNPFNSEILGFHG